MGGMSLWHLLIIMVIILVLFGPNRLPGLGKSIGEAIRGFKKGLNEDPEIDVTASARSERLKESEEKPSHTSEHKHKHTDKV